MEIESAEKIRAREFAALRSRGALLVSYHDFRRTPADLRRVSAQALQREGGDAIKIAAQCADSLATRSSAGRRRGRARRVVAVPMGDVAAAGADSWRCGTDRALAYAPVGEATAPGQISLEEMKNLYRAERLDAAHARLWRDRQSDRAFAFAADAECRLSARGE